MKKENELQRRKTAKFKLKMTFAILVLTALSIAEVYLMMNYQMEYLYLGAVGLVMLCFVYWIVDISFRMQAEDDVMHEKEYENLYKAEKVSYISMKQSFLDIENILKRMEDLPVDDVIQSQKAIGKVTIQRNKESMQTIMDAQKELRERMDVLESKLSEVNGISERQQEILDSIRRMEVSVKDGISNAAVSAPVMQDNQEVQELNFMEEAEELLSGEAPIDDEVSMEEVQLLPEDQMIEESVIEAEELAAEEAQTEEPDAGAMMTEEQIEELLSSQEDSAEEVAENGQEDPAEEVVENGQEDPAAATVMTEEQIAELLSSQETSEPETPIEEEKNSMPDLSDPSHVMTPEEIAALLANI